MRSDFAGPVNIGSEEMVTINQLVDHVSPTSPASKSRSTTFLGPQGVRGRNSDNRLIKQEPGLGAVAPLRAGLERTYAWIEQQVRRNSVA